MNKLMMMAMVAAMGVAGSVSAATSIGYAGQLRDANGGKLEAKSQTVTFKLYKEPTGGSALWSVERAVMLSDEGYFNVELEDDDKKDTADNDLTLDKVLVQYETLYIGLTPKNSTEIAPRQKILCTPHATVAKAGSDGFTVDGTATITTVQTDTIMQKAYDNKYYELLPRGTVVMWAGLSSTIPKGWALCDGQSHTAPDGTSVPTPDMRGRFPVCCGQSTDGAKNYDYSDIGGAQTVQLSEDQLPKHRHQYISDQLLRLSANTSNKGEPWDGAYIKDMKHKPDIPFSFAGNETATSGERYGTSETGNGNAHENRPPFFALCFIMKL